MAKNQFKETTVYEKLYGKPKKYQYYPVKFRIYPSNEVANGIISIIKTSNSFVKAFFKFISSDEALYEKSIRLIENINNPELACIILLREMVKSFKEECRLGRLSQEEYTIKSLFVFNYEDLPSAHIEYMFKNIGDEYYKYYKKHGRSFEDIGNFQSLYMNGMNWIYCRDKGGLYFYDIGRNICYIKLPKLGIINKNVKDLFESDGLSDDAVLPVGFITVDEATTKELIFSISFAVRPEDIKAAFKRDVSEVSLVFYGKYFTNVQIFYPKPDSKVDSIDGFGKEVLTSKALEQEFEVDLAGQRAKYSAYENYFLDNLYVQSFLQSLDEIIISLDPACISILNIATASDFIQDPDNAAGINFLVFINGCLEGLSAEYGFKILRYNESEEEFYHCLECDHCLSTFNDNDNTHQKIENQSIFTYLKSINTDEDDDNMRTGCHGNGCGVSHKLITHTGIKLIKLAINIKKALTKKNPAKK